MGVGYRPGRSCSGGSSYDRTPSISPGNPSATDWTIIKLDESVRGSVIIEARYKGCTNYEGTKIMVFKANSFAEIMKANNGHLDPHFSDAKGKQSPVARFEPTTLGRKLARLAAANL